MTDTSSPASLVERRTASIARYKATGYDVGIEPARDGGWVSYGDFLAYASEAAARLTAMRAELEAAKALADRLKLEAQIHAGEARAANATINEAYQAASGGTGERGNWHGAEPIKAALSEARAQTERSEASVLALQKQVDEARKVIEPFAAAAEFVAEHNPGWDHDHFNIGGSLGSAVSMADFRRARAFLTNKESNDQFIEMTDDGHKMTCRMPADETVVEVRLKDGSVVRAWYSCNIMEAGDFDFLPVDDDDSEPKFDADSIADKVVAWRPAVPNDVVAP